MTPKQERFVAEYAVDCNATQAAIRAGYSEKSANKIGTQLLGKTSIKQAVVIQTQAATKQAGLTADKALNAIRRPLEGDVRKMFDEDGNVKPIHSMSEEEASLIAGYEYVTKNAEAGDGHTDRVLKVRLVDRARYVEMAAKVFKLLTEVHEVKGFEAIKQEIVKGRQRALER